jgi:SulP family sulfate permease
VGSSLSDHSLRAGLTDVFAGAICSVLSIAYCLSYAALIFSGPLEHLLSYGIAVTFLSAAVGGAVVSWRSSLPFAVAGPDSSTSVVIAAFVASVLPRLAVTANGDLLAPTLIAISLSTAVTGLALCILGLARAGRAIRFVPYPVIGGFLGATGWLMIAGAVQVVADRRPTLATISGFGDSATLIKLALAAMVGAALFALLRRSKSPFVLPAVLLGALAIAHVVLLATGTTLVAAQNSGWMFRLQATAGLTLPWNSAALRSFPWAALPDLSVNLLAIIFVTMTSFLLNTTGIEMATRSEADVERDLKVLGLANILSGAVGGYVNCTSLSRSILVYTTGGRGRLAGLTVAATAAAVVIADPAFLGYVPKFVLGGLLFYLGGDLAYRWLIQSSRRLLPLEYMSLLAIAGVIVYSGFVAGVLTGIIIGCATFALSSSRISAIKFSFDGIHYRSALDRGPYERALMAEHGRKIQGIALQSYLFFGSANRLYQHVKTLLAGQPDCGFLIFDFRLVTGIDSSATHSFGQIQQAAAANDARLVLVHLTAELTRAFRHAGLITPDVIVAPDLDRALEFCEQSLIEAHRSEADDVRSLRAWLASALGSPEHAEQLSKYCDRLQVSAGDIIASQGDKAASMHLVLEGRIGIFVESEGGHTIRVRSLGRHTTIGEMGLITGQPRSATIRAETESVLYEISRDAYMRIKRDEPALSQALLEYVIAVMAERLSFANRAVGVLQR